MALVATTFVAFHVAIDQLGPRWGYLTGFVFFWLVWCVTVPVWLLGLAASHACPRGQTTRAYPGLAVGVLLAFAVAGGFVTVLVPAHRRVPCRPDLAREPLLRAVRAATVRAGWVERIDGA